MFLPCELSGDVSYDTAENIVKFLAGKCSLKFFKRTLNMKRHQVFERAIMFLPCELSGDVSYDPSENLVKFLAGKCSPTSFKMALNVKRHQLTQHLTPLSI